MNRSITVAVTLAVAVATALLVVVGGQASAATRHDVDSAIRWQVVAGTFAHRHGAQRLIARLEAKGMKGFVMEKDSQAGVTRFEVERPFDRTAAAHREKTTLRTDGFKPTLEREATEGSL
jgi:cell division septation protein DedD